MNIKKIKGTRDIINFNKYIELFNTIREHLLINKLNEIATPHLHEEKLFIKNIGLESDIVNKEMYYIHHVHENENSNKIVLRPELTTSIMRAYLEEKIQETPWKVFEIGTAFRHERPQKGRYREFYQCSIEYINAVSIGYDLELIILLYSLFTKLIPNLFELQINYIGNTADRRLYKEALYDYCLKNKELFPSAIQEKIKLESILRLLDSKDETTKKILLNAPAISSYWSTLNKNEWECINTNLNALNIPYYHNERLIRGLDYYDGLIFEFTSTELGAQNTFCGGGRYNGIAENINSKNAVPSVGAGIGIDRLLLIQEESKISPYSDKTTKFIAILIECENREYAFNYAIKIKLILEEEKIQSVIYFDKISLKSGLKKANTEKAFISCLITDNQIKNNTIIIKEMNNEKYQTELSYQESILYIKTKYNCKD